MVKLCDKNSRRVKSFDKESSSHSAAVHNLHNDNNRFRVARITDNTSRTTKNRDEEERKGVSEMICKLLQYQGAPEVEIDKFSGKPLE